MSFRSFGDASRGESVRGSKSSRHSSSRRTQARARLLRLESLEERQVLATLYWQGDQSNLWSNVTNWTTDPGLNTPPSISPASGDTLVFATTTNNFNAAPGAAGYTPSNDLVGLTNLALQITDAGTSDFNLSGNAVGLGASGITSNVTAGTGSTLNFGGTGITLGANAPLTATAGALTIAGALALGGNTAAIAGPGNVTVSATVTGTAASSITFAGAAVGNTLTLSGANTAYDGTIQINRGLLAVNNAAALGTAVGGTTIVNTTDAGGAGTSITLNTVAVTAEPIKFVTAATFRTQMTFAGTGNTWGGPITVEGPDLAQFSISGSGTNTISGGITAGPGGFTGTTFFRGGGAGTGNITGVFNMPAGSFNRTDSSLWILSSSGNNWAQTVIATGEFRMGVANALPANAPLLLGQAGTNAPILELNGFSQTVASAANNSTAAGTVTIRNNGAAATLTINNTGANTLATSGSSNLVISGANFNLAKTGGGVLTLGGINTYGGTTTVSDGTLQLSTATAIGDASAVTVTAPGIFSTNGQSETIGSLAGNGAVNITGASVLTNGGNNSSTTYSGTLTGPGTLTKTGTGTLTLSGTSPAAGPTNVNAGSLLVNGSITSNVTASTPGILGGTGTITGTVTGTGTFSPGGLGAVGVLTINGSFTPTGTITFDVNAPYNTAGVDFDQFIVNGSANLTGATMTLNQTIAGAPLVGQTLLVLQNDLADATNPSPNPPEGSLFGVNGTVFKVNYNVATNDVVLTAAAPPSTVYVDDNWSGFAAGTIIPDADPVTPLAQPAIYGFDAFSFVNTAIGVVTVGGTMIVNAGNYNEAVNVNKQLNMTVQEGLVTFGSLDDTVTNATLALGGVTLAVGNNNGTTSFDSVITGTGGLTKNGTGSFTLGGANSYFGQTIVNNGILQITHASALGQSGAGNETIVNGGAGTNTTLLANLAVSNDVSENVSLLSTATGRAVMQANSAQNTPWTGNVTVGSAGAPVQINADGAGAFIISGDISGDVSAGGANQLQLRGGGTAANQIAGSLNLVGNSGINKTDTGFWRIGTAGETYAWTSLIAALGSTIMTAANVLPATSTLQIGQGDTGNATFDLGTFNQTVANLTLNTTGGTKLITGTSPATLTVNNSSPITYGGGAVGGTFGGSVSLTHTGSAAFTLSGGTTVVTNTSTGTLTAAGSGLFTLATGTVFAGDGGWKGPVTVNSGSTMRLGQANIIANTSRLTVLGSGVFDFNNLSDAIGGFSGDGNITLGTATPLIDGTAAGATETFSGVISGTGGITVRGGTGATIVQAFTGLNTFTGAIAIQQGTLAVNTIGNVGSGPSAAGAPTTVANATINLGNAATTGTLQYTGAGGSTDRIIQLAGTTGGGGLSATGAGGITYTSNLSVTGVGIKTFTLTGTSTATNTFAGLIPDSSGGPTTVAKTAAGTWFVTNNGNTYRGETILNGGILNVSSLSNYGVASAIGARQLADENTTVTGVGLHFTGGTLQYTGSTPQSTNRHIRVLNGTNPGAIDASGSNAGATVSFTQTGPNINLFDTAGTRTITLTGTNTGANTFSIPLINQAATATSLSKTGGGKWVLNQAAGQNTYTGTTTITGGTLVIGATNTIPTANTVTVGSGAGTGTLQVSFDQTLASLAVRSNSASFNTIQIDSGRTLTVNGTASLSIGASPAADGQTTKATFAGAGSLVVNNAAAIVDLGLANSNQNNAANSTTVDMSGLGAFSATVAQVRIGYNSQNSSVVTLSNTSNTIIADLLTVGDSVTNNAGSPTSLTLGTGTNVLQVDTLTVAAAKAPSSAVPIALAFASQSPGPGTVSILGKAGGAATTNINIGVNIQVDTGGSTLGTIDLRGHVATVQANVLTMGRTNRGTSNGSATGNLLFDAGTFTVNTIDMANKSGAATGTATATLSIGGGSFTVNAGGSFKLATQATAASATGTLNLTGGTLTSNVDILDGGGTTTTAVNISGGTLNLTNHLLGNATIIDSLVLQSGTMQNVAQINNGGALSKTTGGTLTITGSTYTGPMTVAGGTLVLNSSVPSSATTVQAGATLTGTSVTGPVTIDLGGTHRPGTNAGSVTVNGNYINNGQLVYEFAGSGSTPGVDFDRVQVLASGSVTLGPSSTLSTSFLGTPGTFSPPQGLVYPVVDNDGSVASDTVGQFLGLPEGTIVTVDGQPLTLSYHGGDGNDVVLVAPGTAPAVLYVNDQWTSPGVVDGDLELAGTQTATVGIDAFATIAAALSAYSAYNGTIIVNGGTYATGLLAGGGAISLQLVQDLTNAEANVTIQNLTGDANDGVVTRLHGSNANLTLEQGNFAGTISGDGTLTKTTAGTLTLSGNNTYTGLTTINLGTVVLGSSNALGATTAGTIVNGGVPSGNVLLQLNPAAAINVPEPLTLQSNTTGRAVLQNNSALANIWSGDITVATTGMPMQIQGDGAGSLTITGDISGDVSAGGANALQFRGAGTGANRVAGSLNIVGGINKTDGGTWRFGAAGETYSWNAFFAAVGTTIMTAANVMPAASSLQVGQGDGNTATYDLGGFNQTVTSVAVSSSGGANLKTITSGAAATLTVNNSSPLTLGGGAFGITFTGAASLMHTGSADFTLSGGTTTLITNSTTGTLTAAGTGILNIGVGFNGDGGWAGNATTNAGSTLRLQQNNIFGNSSDFTVNGTLDMNGFSDVVGNLTGTGTILLPSGALTLDDLNGNRNFGGSFVGSGGLTLRGSVSVGTQVLSGASPSWFGTTNVTPTASAVRIVAANNQAFGNGPVAVSAVAGAGVNLNAGLTIANQLTIAGGSVAGFGVLHVPTGTATWSGPINITGNAAAGGHFGSGAGAADSIILGGSITSSVPVVFRAGTMIVAGSGSSFTDAVLGQGTLRVGGNNALPTNVTVNIAVSAAGTFDIAGGFTQTVQSIIDNTPAQVGTLLVSNGTLLVTSGVTADNVTVGFANGAAASGILTVNGGAVAIGTGTAHNFFVARSLAGAAASGVVNFQNAASVAINVADVEIGRIANTTAGTGTQGTLNLATFATNLITANNVRVGDSDNPGNDTIASLLALGNATNELNVDNVTVGGRKSDGTLTLGPGGTLTLRGRAGAGSLANLLIGDNNIGTAGNVDGIVNLIGGTVFADLNTLGVGRHNSGDGSGRGTLSFNAGTINVVNATLAQPNLGGAATSSTTPQNTTGTIVMNGGNFNVSGSLTVGLSGGVGFFDVNGGSVSIGTGAASNLLVGRRSQDVGIATNTSSMSTIDMTGASSATINVNQLYVGTSTTSTNGQFQPFGTLLLANNGGSATNNVTASDLRIGDSAGVGLGGSTSRLGLGNQNILNVATLIVGGNKASTGGRLDFVSPGSSATIGSAGARTNLFIGEQTVGTGGGATGIVDLSSGFVTAFFDQLVIARKPNAATGGTIGAFSMSSGSVDANSLAVAVRTDAGDAGTLTGTLNVSGGTFLVNGTATIGQGNSGVVNTANTTGTLNLSGTGQFLATTATLGANANVNGVVNQTGGTMQFVTMNTAGRSDYNWSGGTIQNRPGQNLTDANVSIDLLPGSHTLSVDAGREATLSAAALLQDAGVLTKVGSGILAVQGANTYSGGTQIFGGSLRIMHPQGFGTGDVNVGNGTDVLFWFNTGTNTVANNVILNGIANQGEVGGNKPTLYGDGGNGPGAAEYTLSGQITLNAESNIGGNDNNDIRITGRITGSGGLTKGGSRGDERSTLTITSPLNNYAGPTNVVQGTLRTGAAEVIPNGSAVRVEFERVLDLGQFNETIASLAGAGSVIRPVTFTGDGDVGISSAKTYTHALDFAGTTTGGAATINGVPFFNAGTNNNVVGPNSYTTTLPGDTTASDVTGATPGSGIDALLEDFYYNSDPLTITLTGLTAGVTYELRLYNRTWAVGARYQNVTIDEDGAGPRGTAFTVEQDSPGNPSYLSYRYTAVSNGSGGALPLTITLDGTTGGTYHAYGLTNEVAGALGALPTLTVGDGASTVFGGTISGPGNVVKQGTGTWTLAGSGGNSYSGTTTVSEGTIVLAKGGTAIPGPLVIGDADANIETVRLAGPNQIADSSAVTVNANGLLNLNGHSDTLGSLAGNGRVLLRDPAGPALARVSFLGDSTVGISSSKTYTHLLDFAAGTTGGAATINGVAFASAGTNNPAGPNNYTTNLSGATTFTDLTGATQGSGIDALLEDFYYDANPAVFTLTGLTPGVTYDARLYVRTWLNLLAPPGRSQNATFDPDGPGGILDTLTFDEDDTTHDPSYLSYRFTATAAPLVITLAATNGGTFHFYGFSNEVVTAPTLTVGDGTSTTFTGAIDGDGNLVKQGAGTLTLGGTSSYTGATTVNGGTLGVASSGALGAGGTAANGTTVNGGGQLAMSGGATIATERLTLNGTGSAANGALASIGGANTWSAPITLASAARIDVDAGTLSTSTINGAFALTVDVAAGTGNILFDGPVGGTTPLASLTINSASSQVLVLDVAMNTTGALAATGDAGVNLTATGVLTAGTTLALGGDLGGDADAVGATMTLAGSFTAPGGATVTTGEDGDLVTINLPASNATPLAVNTGASGDTITVQTSGFGALTLDGQDGSDVYNVALGATPGSTLLLPLLIADSGPTGIDQAIVESAGATNDTFVFTAGQLTRGADTINYTAGLDQLRVRGLDGSDIFNVTPSATTAYFIEGGNPTTAPGDQLLINTGGLAVTDNGSQLTLAGMQPVGYIEIETLSLTAANLTIDGGSGNDRLEIVPTSADDGQYRLVVNGVPGAWITFVDLAGLTFNGLAGNDELFLTNPPTGLFRPTGAPITFNGGGDSDKLTLTSGTGATSQSITFTGPEAGTIVTATPTQTQTILFTGMEDRIQDNVPVAGPFTVTGDSSNTAFALQNAVAPAGYDLLAADNLADVYFDNKAGRFTLGGGDGHDQIEVLLTTPASGITGGITLAGGAGNDRFGTAAHPLKPSTVFPIIVQGGDPVVPQPQVGNAATGDELNLDVTSLTGSVVVDSVAGTISGGGAQNFAYSSIEILHINGLASFEIGDVYLRLSDAAETVVVQSSGVNSIVPKVLVNRVQIPVGTPARRLIIDGRGGDDKISLNGSFLIGGGTDPNQGLDFYGGEGNDTLVGGAQRDRLFGGAGNDSLSGGAGDDYLGINPSDPADLGAGLDKLDGGAGNDILLGGQGNDSLTGGAGDDTMYGGDGNDGLSGLTGYDRLYGQAGNDTITGGTENDLLVGGEGADRLQADGGLDIIIGDTGNDYLIGGGDDDLLIAGSLRVDLAAGGTTTASTTVNDAYDQVLAAVLAGWAASGSFGRATFAATTIATPLGSTRIDLAHVQSSDAAPDTLTGDAGADWLFYSLGATPAQKDKLTLAAADYAEIDFD